MSPFNLEGIMAEQKPKTNKDGLPVGVLLTPEQVAEYNRKRRIEQAKATK
jgi:hypothetical protein